MGGTHFAVAAVAGRAGVGFRSGLQLVKCRAVRPRKRSKREGSPGAMATAWPPPQAKACGYKLARCFGRKVDEAGVQGGADGHSVATRAR